MRFIDLSLTIEGVQSEPEPAQIDYISHREGAFILGKTHGLKDINFPDEMAINLERISLTSHTGTHLDAPYHYGPLSEGQPSKTIEEIPLSWCFGNGVLIDLSNNNFDEPVSKKEVQQYLERIKYTLRENDIVLINTGADKLWGQKEYFTDFRGISLEATEWILQHGIKVIGVDCFSFDPPFHKMLQKYKDTGLKQYLWPAHLYGRKKEYCQIERLTNLSFIPEPAGFTVSCFPIKLKNSGAGWSRVVAMIEN